jgi:hypothetical protein
MDCGARRKELQMAERRTLTGAEYRLIVRTAKQFEPRKAWTGTCEALPELHVNTVYAVLSAAEVIKSRDQVRAVNRESVKRMLEESGSRNTTPWTSK